MSEIVPLLTCEVGLLQSVRLQPGEESSSASGILPSSSAQRVTLAQGAIFTIQCRYTLKVTSADLILIPLHLPAAAADVTPDATALSKVMSSVATGAAAVARGWAGGKASKANNPLLEEDVIIIPRYAVRDIRLLDGMVLVPVVDTAQQSDAVVSLENDGTAHGTDPSSSSPVLPITGITIICKAPFSTICLSQTISKESSKFHHETTPHYYSKRTISLPSSTQPSSSVDPPLSPLQTFTLGAFYFGSLDREKLIAELGFDSLSNFAIKLLKVCHEELKLKLSENVTEGRNTDPNAGVDNEECMTARVYRAVKAVIGSFMFDKQQLMLVAKAASKMMASEQKAVEASAVDDASKSAAAVAESNADPFAPTQDSTLEIALLQELSQSFAGSKFNFNPSDPIIRTICVPVVILTGVLGVRVGGEEPPTSDPQAEDSKGPKSPHHVTKENAQPNNNRNITVSDGASPERNLAMFLFTHRASIHRLTHIQRTSPLPIPFNEVDSVMQNGFLNNRQDFTGHSVECDVVASILRCTDVQTALMAATIRSILTVVDESSPASAVSQKQIIKAAEYLSVRLDASRQLHSLVALVCDFCELLTQQRGYNTEHEEEEDIPSHAHFPVSKTELKWFQDQLQLIKQRVQHVAFQNRRSARNSPRLSSSSSRLCLGEEWELLDQTGSGHLWSLAPQEWFAYDFFAEFHRQKVNWELWGTTFINASFKACATYPPFIIIPRSLTLEEERVENQRRLSSHQDGDTEGGLEGLLSAPPWAASVAERRTRQQHVVIECVLEAAFTSTDNHTHVHKPSPNPATSLPHPQTLVDAFQCRSSQRLQALTYFHSATGAAVLRSSQPMSLRCNTYYASTHQSFWTELLSTSPSGRILVVDLRPFVNAAANIALGGGYESSQHATPNSASHRIQQHNAPHEGLEGPHDSPLLDVEIHFANIANIHVVRSAYESLGSEERSDKHLKSTPETLTTQFQLVLGAADVVASNICGVETLFSDKIQSPIPSRSVLLHCTDGWDRTSQVCALSQILLDPYFRTPKGFCVLIEKDFVSFGHQFRLRGSCVGGNARKSSPIFLQFIDIVHFLLHSNPNRFTFTTRYLMTILALETGCLSGMFAGNCVQEAIVTLQVHRQTLSLWDCLSSLEEFWKSGTERTTEPEGNNWNSPSFVKMAPWHP